MRIGGRNAAALLALAAAVTTAGVASADSFTPVRMTIGVAPVARLHEPLTLTVHVSADAGALDDRSGAVRIQAKLAAECGGTYQYTPGVVLVNKQLSPQPTTNQAYAGTVKGSGKPAAYATDTVCVWLNDADGRTWASDQSTQVVVSKACTTAAGHYDALRHRRRTARSRLTAARRAAAHACGPGVPL